jgi:uncharacterized membrane protein HdeD (DUF308 family)
MAATPLSNSVIDNLAGTLSEHWWALLLRGIVAIAFGVLLFVWPQISLASLVILFGLFAFIDGIIRVWTAVTHRDELENWGLILLGGLAGVAIGVVTWFSPGVTALGLLLYIAVWAVASGIVEIVTAIRLRKVIQTEWLLAFAGLLSVLFGFLLLARPAAGVLALLWLIGAYAIVWGITLIGLAFELRPLVQRFKEYAHPHAVPA